MANPTTNKFDIEKIIEKMTDVDHDFRFMAVTDLADEMQKETFKFNASTERRVVDGIIKLLSDKSGDVQGTTVKTLGPLVQRVSEENVTRIITALLDHICELDTKKSKMREISTLGLKAIIKSVDEKHGAKVSEQLVSELIKGVQIKNATQVTSECLDILNDLLKRFGSSLNEKYFQLIVDALLPELKGKHQLAKNRAIHCLASISPFISEDLFRKIGEDLLEGLKAEDNKRTYIQAVGILARGVGKRIGFYVDKMSPLLIDAIKSEGDEEDDMKDYALQTFESFLVSCRENVNEKLFETIFQIASEKISYDPNYNEDEDDKGSDEENGSGDGSDEQDEEFDDELDEPSEAADDESWKVRRASSKILGAIVSSSSPTNLLNLAEKIATTFVKRFSERAEAVRLEIYANFVGLLKQLQHISKTNNETVMQLISNLTPSIIKQLLKQLKSNNPKTKVAVFQVLKELVNISPLVLESQIQDLIVPITACVNENKNLMLKIEAISFVRLLWVNNRPEVLIKFIQKISDPIFASVKSPNHQAATEALKVCSEFLKMVDYPQNQFDVSSFVQKTREAISPQFRANDIDLHIKEAAINAVSILISKFADKISQTNLLEDLKLLTSRLKNEITRSATVTAFEMIGSSNRVESSQFSFILSEVTEELVSCLRKASRQLKTGALSTLYVLVKNYGKLSETNSRFNAILEELSALLDPISNDLYIYQLSLKLATEILTVHPSSANIVKEKLFSQVVKLINTCMIEGQALNALLSFFGNLAHVPSEFSFEFLLHSLLNQKTDSKKNKNFL